METKDIRASSCLVPSKLPGADYVINPYVGCRFGCVYCYASFMGRLVNEPVGNWGNYVYAKTNIVGVLENELKSWSKEKRQSRVLLSSVTDPYQGAEARYELSRGILSVLVREQYPGLVSILTKSPLVLRDIDLIKHLPNAEVGMTVTTTDDATSRLMESGAPLNHARIDALEKLNAQGIKTYAFVGPLLPHFRYRPELLDAVFKSLAEAGVKDVFIEHMNLKGYIKERLVNSLKNELPNAEEIYSDANSEEHKRQVETIAKECIQRYGLRLILGQVLDHNPIC